jgi:two-component system chemotaxis response regulator CheY
MTRPTSALIVDDESHVRVFVRLLLKELGITQTWEASDGATALELVRANDPGLVLLDINMPVMTGLEMLAQLQESNPDLPVIMISSESAMPTVREGARLGAIGYILKQGSREQALEALREALDEIDRAGEDGEETET